MYLRYLEGKNKEKVPATIQRIAKKTLLDQKGEEMPPAVLGPVMVRILALAEIVAVLKAIVNLAG